jgi:hypothetical protein
MFNFDLYSRMVALASAIVCVAGCSGAPDADPTAPSVDESEAHVDSVNPTDRFGSAERYPGLVGPTICFAGNPTIPLADIHIGAWTSNGFPIHLDGTACPGDHLTLLVNGNSGGNVFNGGNNTATAGADGSFAFDVNYSSKAFCGKGVSLEVSIPSTTRKRETDVSVTLPPC